MKLSGKKPSTKKKKVMYLKHYFYFINSHCIKLLYLKCIVNGLFLPTVEGRKRLLPGHIDFEQGIHYR